MPFHLIPMAILAALLLPAAAVAASSPIRGAVLFFAVDKNGDGAVDRSEADGFRAFVFDAIDTNKDGRVTGEEVGVLLVPIDDKAGKKEKERLQKKRNQILKFLSLAKPEGVAKDEFVALNDVIFVKADVDKDGKATPKEFAVILKSFGPLLPR
jgi:Ca2+-binding EF-hand superfamily protein